METQRARSFTEFSKSFGSAVRIGFRKITMKESSCMEFYLLRETPCTPSLNVLKKTSTKLHGDFEIIWVRGEA